MIAREPNGGVVIIGGGGWLGRALALGLLRSGFVEEGDLHLVGRSATPEPLEGWPQVKRVTDCGQAVEQTGIVILSVRPDSLPSVVLDAGDRMLVSVMAGVPISSLRRFGTDRIVRCMPSASAAGGRSYTPWYAATSLPERDVTLIRTLMHAFGESDRVIREADLDYLTALSGSGPAFPSLMARAMIEHAIAVGVPAATAGKAVASTLRAASDAVGAGEDPAGIVRKFTDYGGTTAAGIEAMTRAGFERAVHAGIEVAAAEAGFAAPT